MKDENPEDAVMDFLTNAPRDVRSGRGGAPCQTCRHAKREEVERASRFFNEKKRKKETSASWVSFVKNVLKPRYAYTLDYRALKNHLERCCDVEINT